MPWEISKNANQKYLFDCNTCDHEFPGIINHIVNNNVWCPYCSVPTKKLCNDLNCKHCFNRSFASHPKSVFWSNKNVIEPRFIIKNSKIHYIFRCDLCPHDFKASLTNVCNNRWCSYCNGDKLCDNIDCQWCIDRSATTLPKSSDFDVNTRQIRKYSNKIHAFTCKYCGHSYDKIISIDGCKYCSHKELCDDDQCEFCLNNSFASKEESKYWSDKNQYGPSRTIANSKDTIWLKCNVCHQDYPRAAYSKSGCPCQKNKTEKKLYDKLLIHYPELKLGFRASWCKNNDTNQVLPFDFILSNDKVIIELDGRQHFEQVMEWASPDDQMKRDIYKMQRANANGFSIIRIIQEDVYHDRNDWLTKLIDSITSIQSRDEICNKFICKNNEYDNMIMKFNEI